MALNPTSSRAGGTAAVTSVAAANATIVVAGTATDPTLRTATLDVIANTIPPANIWSNNNHQITNVAPGSTAGDVATFDQLPAKSSSSAALGLSAMSINPNGGLGAFIPGGGELVRLVLLETMPAGVITGAAIGLESLGVAPSGTAQLGLATFSGADVATYVAVTADISAALTAGALGIRRFDFAVPYVSDGNTPLWVAIAFTDGWGTDITVAAFNAETTLGGANAGHYRPRYTNIAAGAGTLVRNGTHNAWSGVSAFELFAGIY